MRYAEFSLMCNRKTTNIDAVFLGQAMDLDLLGG